MTAPPVSLNVPPRIVPPARVRFAADLGGRADLQRSAGELHEIAGDEAVDGLSSRRKLNRRAARDTDGHVVRGAGQWVRCDQL